MKKIIVMTGILLIFQLYGATPLHIIAPQQLARRTFTISEPGLYVLGGDPIVTLTAEPGISINSSNVTLDLNGKSIIGQGTPYRAISIESNVENVTIKNGIISGFHNRGIFMDNPVSNIFIEDIDVTGTSRESLSFIGFDVSGGTGTSSQVILRNCQAISGMNGVRAESMNNLNIEDGFFSNNYKGLVLQTVQNIYATNSQFNSNVAWGIEAISFSGIYLNQSVFNSNGIEGVTVSVPFVGPAQSGTGAVITTGSTISVRDCTFNNNLATGFWLVQDVESVTIEKSVFDLNGALGIESDFQNDIGYIDFCRASNNGFRSTLFAGGLFLLGCNSWQIKNSDFSNNTVSNPALASGGIGVLIEGSDNMLLENCTFFDNSITTTAGDTNSRAAGVDIRDTNSCIIRNCIMSGSVNFGSGNGARAVGINLNGNSHIIENCTFLGNTYLGNAVSSSLPVKAVGIYLEEVKTSSFIVISNCRASGNADLSGTNSGIGFHIGSNTQSCIIKDCQAYDNTHIGFNNISTGAAFLFGNIAAGNPANNYDGTGTFSFVTVTNGINPPQGSFDERQIDNISIV